MNQGLNMNGDTLEITNDIHQMRDIAINGVNISIWTRHDGKIELTIHDKEKTVKSVDMFGKHKDMKITKFTKHFDEFSVLKMERV